MPGNFVKVARNGELAPGQKKVVYLDGERVLPTMISTSLKDGERIYHRQAGGGGWGNSLKRSAAAVARDVRNDKVSAQSARQHYGVVIDETTGQVNKTATEQLRRKRLKVQRDQP